MSGPKKNSIFESAGNIHDTRNGKSDLVKARGPGSTSVS